MRHVAHAVFQANAFDHLRQRWVVGVTEPVAAFMPGLTAPMARPADLGKPIASLSVAKGYLVARSGLKSPSRLSIADQMCDTSLA